MECHHVIPLHEAGEGQTKLIDLALVCANCHRMIHRRAPVAHTWRTSEPGAAIQRKKSSASRYGCDARPTQPLTGSTR
ncbi:HNH endonuclease [Streptomyces brasiliscabiei]|uniref:HNH endonuclease n=1 Tax=Streptomyces brasiliscabiei TaxID=2736302 RepID=UPI0027DF75D2|nr:HNH endonuclease [Streptomyces brasiliscabiei]